MLPFERLKVLGDEATRMAMYPQLDANDVVMVLEKVTLECLIFLSYVDACFCIF